MSESGRYVAYDLTISSRWHTHWLAARAGFFLPVRVLAEVFRGKLLAKLEAAINRAKNPRAPR